MNIVHKTSNGKPIFVFQFEDEADRDFWLNEWENCVVDAPENYEMEYVSEIISKLKNRIDSKYATTTYKLSGMLFLDEFLDFAFGTTFLMCSYKRMYDETKSLCDRWEALSYDWRKLYEKISGSNHETTVCESVGNASAIDDVVSDNIESIASEDELLEIDDSDLELPTVEENS